MMEYGRHLDLSVEQTLLLPSLELMFITDSLLSFLALSGVLVLLALFSSISNDNYKVNLIYRLKKKKMASLKLVFFLFFCLGFM